MAIDTRTIVTQAYQVAGVTAFDTGDSPSGSDATLAVQHLNLLVQQLNVDQLFPFSMEYLTGIPIVTSKLSYTIGLGTPPNADFVYQRPAFIQRIMWYPALNSAPLNVQQLSIPELAYQRKSITSTGAPCYYAFNPKYPNAVIEFDIKPISSGFLALIYNTEVPTVTIDTTLQIPSEYGDLLTTALARRLSVMKQMSGEIQGSCDTLYKSSLNRVKANHSRTQIPTLDSMLEATNIRVNKHNILVG